MWRKDIYFRKMTPYKLNFLWENICNPESLIRHKKLRYKEGGE